MLTSDNLADASLLPRKPIVDEAKFDITAMIDLVFMMNIFFLVTMVTAALEELNLPAARHCVPADPTTAVIVSILEGANDDKGRVYVGEGVDGPGITEPEEQQARVREAVEEGVREGRSIVLIKAERHVRLRDIGRVATIAGAVPGTDLRLAVIEKE